MPPTPATISGAIATQLLDLPSAAAATAFADQRLAGALAAGDAVATDQWRTARGHLLIRRGHLDDGLADLELVMLRASVAGNAPYVHTHTGLVDCFLARGELWRARRSATPITRALAAPARPGADLPRAVALHALGDLARAERDHATAWRHFVASGEALGDLADHPALLPWRLEAAVSAVQLGLRAEASELIDTHLDLALRDDRPTVVARALRVRAAVVGHPDGLALLEQAAALVDREDTPRLAALVLVDLAAHLLLSGADGVRVAGLLHAAEGIGRRFGLTTTVSRVERLLAVLGREVVPPQRRRGDRLTGLARLVAEMAVAGADDEEIAAALGLPEAAVRREVAEVCRLLGIRSRRRIGESMALPPAAARARPVAQPAGSAT